MRLIESVCYFWLRVPATKRSTTAQASQRPTGEKQEAAVCSRDAACNQLLARHLNRSACTPPPPHGSRTRTVTLETGMPEGSPPSISRSNGRRNGQCSGPGSERLYRPIRRRGGLRHASTGRSISPRSNLRCYRSHAETNSSNLAKPRQNQSPTQTRARS